MILINVVRFISERLSKKQAPQLQKTAGTLNDFGSRLTGLSENQGILVDVLFLFVVSILATFFIRFLPLLSILLAVAGLVFLLTSWRKK